VRQRSDLQKAKLPLPSKEDLVKVYAVSASGGALFATIAGVFVFGKSILSILPEPQPRHLPMSMPVIFRIRPSGWVWVFW